VAGYSYGGYLSAWAIGRTDRFRKAVIGAPVVDTVSMLGTTDIPYFTLHGTGADPSASPLSLVDHVSTPVLLVHHDGDLRCPVGQSDQYFTALRLAGVEVTYARYPGGFHGVAAPEQLVDRVARSVDWIVG